MAGQPTDDSELALMLARTLIAHGLDVEAIASAYGRWCSGWTHEEGPVACNHAGCRPFDIGSTTRQALGAITPQTVLVGGAAHAAIQAANQASQANGALMRVSPIAIWGAGRPPHQVADAARQDARLTHPNPVCVEASSVYAATIAQAIANGGSPREVYNWAVHWASANCNAQSVTAALAAAASSSPSSYTDKQGWVLLSLQNAFFQLLHAASLEDGVVATVRAGGDTDTNGTIAGALLGAVHARDAVPCQWQRMITSCRPMFGYPPVHQPRPAMFWPTDAMILVNGCSWLVRLADPMTENPWHDLPSEPPFLLPCDESAVGQYDAENRSESHRLHLELLPEPFLGRPDAPVVLLNLNPGFSAEDLAAHRRPDFAQAARLTHHGLTTGA